MMAAINSQSGIPHSSTLRNPGLYTARISTIARKIQTMTNSRPMGRNASIAHSGARVQNGVTL